MANLAALARACQRKAALVTPEPDILARWGKHEVVPSRLPYDPVRDAVACRECTNTLDSAVVW